ncbi:MAG: hypothetical protein R3E08_13530 [Thiotrichaceae bacterium]
MQNVDIMIHINEQLSHDQQTQLEILMRNIQGVIAPRFNKSHLLVVSYDTKCTRSSKLLDAVKSQGYQAQLVGI